MFRLCRKSREKDIESRIARINEWGDNETVGQSRKIREIRQFVSFVIKKMHHLHMELALNV